MAASRFMQAQQFSVSFLNFSMLIFSCFWAQWYTLLTTHQYCSAH